ncbi:DNA primase catalytic subunit [Bradyrhizobium sp. USDA 4501]
MSLPTWFSVGSDPREEIAELTNVNLVDPQREVRDRVLHRHGRVRREHELILPRACP